MKKVILMSVISAIALMGCSEKANTEPAHVQTPAKAMCSTEAMPGGWFNADEVSPEAHRAVELALEQMDSTSALKQITDVRTQVVAGMNYAVEFELENGEVWHAVVYQNLNDEYTVTKIATPGKLCG